MRSFQRKKPKMTASFMLTAVEEGVCVTERERGGETVVCVCVCVCGGGGGGVLLLLLLGLCHWFKRPKTPPL